MSQIIEEPGWANRYSQIDTTRSYGTQEDGGIRADKNYLYRALGASIFLRVAYCLMVYKDPEQVSRLIDRLYSTSDYFLVHKDKSTPSSKWESITRKFLNENLFYTTKYSTGWAAFEWIEALLDRMNYCRNFDYDYLIVLSGQCYPIRPIHVIKQELEKKNVAYMEYFKLPSSRWEKENGGLDRINYYYVRLGGSAHPRWIRIPRLRGALPYNLEPYGGSSWVILPKIFVNYVLDYVSSHPKIMSFYRHVKIADEMFFQTIIMNSPLRSDVVNDDRMFLVWKGKRNPEILREKDFEEIVRSDKLFARKFDINIDERILDLVDERIHGLN